MWNCLVWSFQCLKQNTPSHRQLTKDTQFTYPPYLSAGLQAVTCLKRETSTFSALGTPNFTRPNFFSLSFIKYRSVLCCNPFYLNDLNWHRTRHFIQHNLNITGTLWQTKSCSFKHKTCVGWNKGLLFDRVTAGRIDSVSLQIPHLNSAWLYNNVVVSIFVCLTDRLYCNYEVHIFWYENRSCQISVNFVYIIPKNRWWNTAVSYLNFPKATVLIAQKPEFFFFTLFLTKPNHFDQPPDSKAKRVVTKQGRKNAAASSFYCCNCYQTSWDFYTFPH